MITKGKVWYNVFPKDYAPTSAEVGKWLYFNDKTILHSWLPKLNDLVEAGKLPDDNYQHLLSSSERFGAVDKDDPRVVITITDLSLNP